MAISKFTVDGVTLKQGIVALNNLTTDMNNHFFKIFTEKVY